MNIPAVSIRWIYATCFEMKLPGGKTLLIDPYITEPELKGFSVEDVEGADYIVISHSHFDHIMDLKYLAEKFNSKIIAPITSVFSLAHQFGLKYDHFLPISPDEELLFEDLSIRASRTKHVKMGSKRDYAQPRTKEASTDPMMLLNMFGSFDGLNYLFTTKNNFRILLSGGGIELDNPFRVADEYYPNVVIRQTSQMGTPAEFAKTLARYHAQLYLPHHHENLARVYNIDAEAYLKETDEELQKILPGARFLNPDQYRWYQVGVGAW